MRCSKCGAEVPAGSGFCPTCGEMLSMGMGAVNSAGAQNNMGMSNYGGRNKSNSNTILIFSALIVVLVVVIIGVIVTRKDKVDVAKEASVDQEEVVMLDSEEKREELAEQVTEDFFKDIIELIVDVAVNTSSRDDLSNHERELGELLSKYYPKSIKNEMKDQVWDGFGFDDVSESDLRDLANDPDVESFRDGLKIKIKIRGTEELDKDELEELKELVESDFNQTIDDFEWGYRVTADVALEEPEEFGSGNMETEVCYYVAYVDGKCGIYATEEDGRMYSVKNLF